jgi:type I restriction enzyme M protein
LGKTNSLSEKDLDEFVELQKTKANSENSWSLDAKKIDQKTFDLSVKNPSKGGEVVLREPREILREIKKLDRESEKILKIINNQI